MAWCRCFIMLLLARGTLLAENDLDLYGLTDEQEFTEEPFDNWMDMNDMENFDPNRRMRAERNSQGLPQMNIPNRAAWTNCKNEKKEFEDLNSLVNSYIHRYIGIFLQASELMGNESPTNDEAVQVIFETLLTPKDIHYLKNFLKNKSNARAYTVLENLDSIFQRMVKVKMKSPFEAVFDKLATFIMSLEFSHFSDLSNNAIVMHTSALVICLFLSRCFFQIKSKAGIVIVVLNTFLSIESIFKYFLMVKEAKIQNYVRMLQESKPPPDCDQDNMTWYQTVYSWFSSNQCLNYHLTMVKDSLDEVSIVDCFVETYCNLLIVTPFSMVGRGVKKFGNELSSVIPPPFDKIFYGVFAIAIVAFSIPYICHMVLKLIMIGGNYLLKGNTVDPMDRVQNLRNNSGVPEIAPVINSPPVNIIYKLPKQVIQVSMVAAPPSLAAMPCITEDGKTSDKESEEEIENVQDDAKALEKNIAVVKDAESNAGRSGEEDNPEKEINILEDLKSARDIISHLKEKI